MKATLPYTSVEALEARIAPALLSTFDTANLDGHNGFKIKGVNSEYASISDAGDVNGDGFADIIVGDPKTPGNRTGVSYVIFGKAAGFNAEIDVRLVNGRNGFKITGGAEFGYAGTSVTSAGDVNGDGFDDLLIGAPGRAAGGTFYDYHYATRGAGYVIFGKAAAFPANFKLSALNGSNGFKLSESAYHDSYADRFGPSVSGGGDINGDGFDDIIVSSTYEGDTYVVFGKSGGFTARFDLESVDGNNGFKTYSEMASGAGDVNGDGFDDLLLAFSNSSFVVFGRAQGFAAELELFALDGTDGFRLTGAQEDGFGEAMSDAGDLNGDGFADFVIGARDFFSNPLTNGASYVVFGTGDDFPAELDVSTLNGSNGFKLTDANYSLGYSVSGAGDVNGDGFDDLLIEADYSGYVVYGKAGGFAGTIDLSTIKGADGFRIDPAPQDNVYSTGKVSKAGDINGDGFDDVIVDGARYVVFGSEANGFSPDGRTAHVLDGDGDLVTITTSKGRLHPSDFTFGVDGGIALLDLRGHAAEFAKANITIKATTPPGGTGDGVAKVGQFLADGVDLGAVKIDGHLGLICAGDGDIRTAGMQMLDVKGLGGPGGLHSEITGAMGALLVRGDVMGADVSILGGTKARLGRFEIDGDVGDGSAFLISGDLGPTRIGGDLSGGGIHVGGRMGSLNVHGDVLGDSPDAPLVISALGKFGATTVLDAMAIRALTIGGNVTNTQVLAGYAPGGGALNGDAGIGPIVIHGSFAASDIVAGVADSTGDGFGQNDTVIPGGLKWIAATIASLTIKGTATGSAASGDFFGITAQAIYGGSIHGVALALKVGKDNRLLDTVNGDLRLVEV